MPVLIVTMTYCRICNFLHFHNYKSNKSFTSTPTVDRFESKVIDNDNGNHVFQDDNCIETVSNRGDKKTVKINRKQSSQLKFNRATISKRKTFIRDHSRNIRQKRFERSKNLLILVSLTFVICWQVNNIFCILNFIHLCFFFL